MAGSFPGRTENTAKPIMKILIVKLSSLGDILHMFPAASDLRRRFPAAEIHWLAEPAFAEAVSWHSAIDKVIVAPLRAHKKTWWKIPALLGKLRAQLRNENYDAVLDAQGLLKSAVLARLAGAPVSGFAAAREPLAARLYHHTADVPQGLHIIDKNRQLIAKLFDLDITTPADFGLDKFRQQSRAVPLPDALEKLDGKPYMVLLHGTTWNSKYWPETSWLELIHLLAAQGVQCLLPWGNAEEYARATRLQEAGGKYAQVLPKLSLSELMNVLLHAQGYVSVESGIGHLAAALDVPGIMLHGPTSPGYSGIVGKACRHITSEIACSPCFRRDCPILDEAGIPPCQRMMNARRVYQEYLEWISGNRACAPTNTAP